MAAQSASGSRCTAHCTRCPEIRQTATSRGPGGKSCFGGVGRLTYVSCVVFQERASEGATACKGRRGAHYTALTVPGCLPGVYLDCDQDQAEHSYPALGNEPLWMETSDMQRKLSCLDPGWTLARLLGEERPT